LSSYQLKRKRVKIKSARTKPQKIAGLTVRNYFKSIRTTFHGSCENSETIPGDVGVPGDPGVAFHSNPAKLVTPTVRCALLLYSDQQPIIV
jgi:hypothetical protein